MKIAIAVLCILIGVLAYFAAIYQPNVQDEIDKGPLISPNVMNRVRQPTPPAAMEAIVKAADEPWIINGKAVGKPVTWTQLNQRTMSNAQMRRLYNMHE